MPKPDYHVFVCSMKRPPGHPRGSCGERGADALTPAFAQALMKRGILQKVLLTQTTCLGPCQGGANVLVYPGSVMYSNVQPADVDHIVEEHFVGGVPVQAKVAGSDIW
ncbi:MAG: (2Fe-2S) ferredoxin domain-containing protein [Spongiibacteraceae bacterium]